MSDLAIETVAREAAVSKATIYRWWNTKAALVLDAFMESHFGNVPMPSGVDPRSAIKRHLTSLMAYFNGPAGQLVTQILCEGQVNDALMAEFNSRFAANRRLLVQETFRRGQEEGLFRSDIDPTMACEMMYSIIYRRLFFRESLDAAFRRKLLRSVDLLFSTDPKRKPSRAVPPR